jgi:hypothetical protein
MEHKYISEDWKEEGTFLGRINIYKNAGITQEKMLEL